LKERVGCIKSTGGKFGTVGHSVTQDSCDIMIRC